MPGPLCAILSKVAVNIKTEDWNQIIANLKEKGWMTSYKYSGFDAGIDHDFQILKKGSMKILFGWSNWFEGEIKCNDKTFKYLEDELDREFEYGEPTTLKNSLILVVFE